MLLPGANVQKQQAKQCGSGGALPYFLLLFYLIFISIHLFSLSFVPWLCSVVVKPGLLFLLFSKGHENGALAH
jgi:hypothetical protein